ncbi:suppressor of tumorigenicity 14-like protein [Chlorella sorokiniana]|uniref:Suppressor of tumorigenicity 14-like protein n=1 Tax=Chlorella sorokiniana TaxID=3076 RepID=A0A2P6TJY9_CHLSO|nr:suppressor of tumorigenicity 14-like protein [Chlorella sorokiniana]|eukprot:PRW44396.1 suppressor of tumorigenicity 14-like protein [Chlorella sorokiniana]
MRAALCLAALLAIASLTAPTRAVRVLQQSEEAAALAAPAPAAVGKAPAPAPAAADALELLPAEMGTYVLQEPENQPSAGRTVEFDGQELQLQDGHLATMGPVPEADGFTPAEVSEEDKGTCNLNDEPGFECGDGMDDGSSDSDFLLLQDPEMALYCGITDLDQRVEEIVDWAYDGEEWGGSDCGIVAYTVSKMCVGQGASEGQWRGRVQLWPTDPDQCKSFCVKMRGTADSVDVYGRTATC